VDLGKVDRTVFGPRTFAAKAAGTNYVLKLNDCKAWIAGHFPKIRPMGAWPAATPVASAAPAPSGSAAP
jgi:hypothetical protein